MAELSTADHWEKATEAGTADIRDVPKPLLAELRGGASLSVSVKRPIWRCQRSPAVLESLLALVVRGFRQTSSNGPSLSSAPRVVRGTSLPLSGAVRAVFSSQRMKRGEGVNRTRLGRGARSLPPRGFVLPEGPRPREAARLLHASLSRRRQRPRAENAQSPGTSR